MSKERRKTIVPRDEHFSKHAIGAYGYDAWVVAMVYTKGRGTFVDVGAHMGHFTYNALSRFKEVIAFEPIKLNFRCLEANVGLRLKNAKRKPSVRLFNAAVGDVEIHKANVVFSDPSNGKNSGAWEVEIKEDGPDQIDFLTIDMLDLKDCDLIKIDTQGWESRVIKGALKTIKRCKPCLIVEVVNHENINVGLMEEIAALGYRMMGLVQKNALFRHRNA